MDKNERNEHFKGFAELLFTEICKLPGVYIEASRPEQEEAIPRLIAQCAYDLAYHFIESSYQHKGTFRGEIHQTVKMLPDLTEWPKTASQSSAPDE